MQSSGTRNIYKNFVTQRCFIRRVFILNEAHSVQRCVNGLKKEGFNGQRRMQLKEQPSTEGHSLLLHQAKRL